MTLRLLLVDALNLVRRVYAAHPGEDGPERVEGALESCDRSLKRALEECEPTHALVVFDGVGPTWRHESFPEYKANHRPMPEVLAEALPEVRRRFAQRGVASFSLAGQEADDVIATLAVKTAGSGGQAAILSTDKAFLQLLAPGISCRDHFKRENLGPDYVRERFGVDPEHFVDYLALTGDPSTGIPGVSGVGPKTATLLLGRFGTLDRLLAAVERGEAGELTAARLRRLQEGTEDALRSRRLLRLSTDLDLGLNLRDLRLAG